DPLAQEGLDVLAAHPDIQYDVRTGLAGQELRDALAEYEGAICRSGVKVTADALAGGGRLKAVVRAGVGTDNIDLDAATRQGVVVMNTPMGNTLSTAEHTFAMMLALSRNIAPANQSLVEGRWDRKKFMGAQLAEKTLGIVGMGRIGRAVAERALAFEMKVIGFDPFLSAERGAQMGIEVVPTVREMLPRVDYLTVHTPLTDETRGLISREQLDLLRPGVRLINCARGGIYDEAALAEGLETGKIAGVALDVYATEPCTDSPLFGKPGVLCTPHLGASTEEAQTNVAVEAATLLVDFLTTGAVRHAVNTPSLDAKVLEQLRGELELVYRLGLLQAQMERGSAKNCRLIFRGQVASKDTKLLVASFAAGLLENAMDQPINIVNAEMLLRDRGIDIIEECHSEVGDFASMIVTEVEGDGGMSRASGTIFGNKLLRLVRLGEFRLESYLDGILFIFEHNDVPGIVGSVGTIFGRHQVNIAQMSVGRAGEEPGGLSIGVLNLDTVPPEDAIAEVLKHPDIERVSVIKLPPQGVCPSWMSG
ncbi:MAG: phosphoglycerate dehydrogenase, partial [Planctomycetales bacterium]|nr:phosphoglycerate dehydrogenase [Planctomycetales bacterium]